jgi:hypothetical protein
MFELIKSEVLPLTPDLARQFKEMEPSPTERDLNPARLKMLRDKADKEWQRSQLRRAMKSTRCLMRGSFIPLSSG